MFRNTKARHLEHSSIHTDAHSLFVHAHLKMLDTYIQDMSNITAQKSHYSPANHHASHL